MIEGFSAVQEDVVSSKQYFIETAFYIGRYTHELEKVYYGTSIAYISSGGFN